MPSAPSAGPECENAVYYPEDEKFLLSKDPNVLHYEMLSRPAGSPGSSSPKAAHIFHLRVPHLCPGLAKACPERSRRGGTRLEAMIVR